MRLVLLLLVGLLQVDVALANDFTVYLIRHGEKQLEQGKDPALAVDGLQRADNLAQMLSEAPLTAIYSTDYRRTQQTVAALAGQKGIEVQSYPPGQLATLAATLKKHRQNALVVGHSNTTPELLALLGGGDVQMDESNYGDLYQLVFVDDKVVLTHLRVPLQL